MSEFHEGRVAATHQLGCRLEDTKEAYEKEIVGLEGMKAVLIVAVKQLEEYRKQVQYDGAQARIPIKEAETGVKYVNSSIEILQRLFHETEGKRFAAFGAIEALKRVVADTKKAWDAELAKLNEIKEFEAQQPKDMKSRPVGYMPEEKPLDEYKQSTEHLEVQAPAPDVAPEKPTKKPRKRQAKAQG